MLVYDRIFNILCFQDDIDNMDKVMSTFMRLSSLVTTDNSEAKQQASECIGEYVFAINQKAFKLQRYR